jgi:hypothetical protein
MHLTQFLDALSRTPRRWSIKSGGQIRMLSLRGDCENDPISAVRHAIRTDGEAVDPFEAHVMGTARGISRRTMRRIIEAADHLRLCDQSLRRRLLKACGLTQQRGDQYAQVR